MQQSSNHSAKKQNGDEYGHQRKSHRDNRESDFLRRKHRGFESAFAHFHISHDVFEHDDRVVDDETHAQCQCHQRERVKAVAEQINHGKRPDDRQHDSRAWN